jgi:hypothetical protein
VALPPDDEARYHGKPIPPDYALVDMASTNNDFDEDELDIPTKREPSSSALLSACACYGTRQILS